MGSYSRLVEALKPHVQEKDMHDVVTAIELLQGAGDDLGDIVFMWYDEQGEAKDDMIDKARAHILKLQKAIDRIAISQ